MIKKKNIKNFCLLGSLLLGMNSFAQEIELPSVTTVIEDKNEVEKAKEVLDFDTEIDSIDLDEVEKITLDLPLPEDYVKEELESPPQLSHYAAKGAIGGGYPTSFIGDFAFSTVDNPNPLSLDFMHHGYSGFASKNLSDGFYTKETAINLKKSFILDTFTSDFSIKYEDKSRGLQNQVENIAAVNQDLIFADINFSFILPKGFSIGTLFSTDFYYRYADITKNDKENFTCPDWIRQSNFFHLSPTLYAKWNGEAFNLAFAGNYALYNSIHRGNFNLSASWKNDIWNIYADMGLVIGNSLNENKLILPFTMKIDAAFPLKASDNKIKLALAGGLKSYQDSPYELESEYKFSGVNNNLSEVSDWFTKIDLSFPLKEVFQINSEVEYNLTAFDNGRWLPAYNEENFVKGLYCYNQSFTEILRTSIGISYKYKLWAFNFNWDSNWIDLLPGQLKNIFNLNLAFADKNEKWGLKVNAGIPISSEDKTAIIDFDIFASLTDSLKVELISRDLIKLCTATKRAYEGCYISQGGNVTILIKFLF